MLRELNSQEIEAVAGGCGPGMFDGLFEGIAMMFGMGVAAAFVLGAGTVYAIQYFKTH